MNIVLISYFVLHLWVLVFGFWQKKTLRLEFILAVPTLLICFWLLSLEQLVVFTGKVQGESAYWLLSRLDYVVTAVIVFIVAATIYDLYKYYRLYRNL